MKIFQICIVCLLMFCNLAKASENVRVKHYTNLSDNNLTEILLEFDIAPNWHIFAPYEQEFGTPLKVEWKNLKKTDVLEESYSKTKRYNQDMISFDGYETKAFYKSTLRSDKNIEKLIAEISWMECSDECIRRNKIIEISKEKHPQFEDKINKNINFFLSSEYQPFFDLGTVLFMAFVGGIILNFMPCIFPILSIKVISLANMNNEQRSIEAVFYGIGVVISMLVVAGVLYGLRIFDNTIGWGFHMQSSWFVGFMFILFIILTLLMLDIININNSFLSKLAFLHFENHKVNAFMTGLLAVLIATPCSAPFMGASIAYALMAPIYIYVPVFLSLGIGYALPFALLAWNPLKFKRILPKPGKWMNVLKKILSIPLILTCVWLFWILLSQSGIVVSGKNLNWQNYSQHKIEQALKNKQPVFVDFTANWCITCLVNKKTALQSDKFAKIVKEKNILLLRADATDKNENVNKGLTFYGRASVPLYIYYDGKSDDYLILPQILTGDVFEEYLN